MIKVALVTAVRKCLPLNWGGREDSIIHLSVGKHRRFPLFYLPNMICRLSARFSIFWWVICRWYFLFESWSSIWEYQETMAQVESGKDRMTCWNHFFQFLWRLPTYKWMEQVLMFECSREDVERSSPNPSVVFLYRKINRVPMYVFHRLLSC